VQYSQRKTGLPFLITKRWTEDDGVTLSALPEPAEGVNAVLDDDSSAGESEAEEELLSDTEW